MAFLQLNALSKRYGAVDAVVATDLAVEKGEFVSLLGPSGCGKTTTLQMIAGFVDVSGGQILLDGRDITHAKPASRGLGVVFQSYALFPHMSVRDNVAFGLKMRKVPAAEIASKVKTVLELVRLAPHAERYPRELSGGQRQRVALARALVIEPPVLLLDEPLSNLDANLREEMQFEIRRIQCAVGITTLMVTHDQAEALSISDRVVVMQAGRVTQIDAPYKLYEHPRTRFISDFVGKANLLAGDYDEFGTAQVRLVGGKGELVLSLRPEKIQLVDAGAGRLQGKVLDSYFFGSQWLYRIQTSLGEITVVRSNDGSAPLGCGAPVGLDWHAELLRVLAADEVRA
ncbi:ABC transporter ATP-binding protein [Pseudomonas edaphica]|jgi:putative spermidine/putrescine transport system ATP-binding protein|uniref:ABC transporter ATP-binding protein n=1 Tax=Pseudomonas edaphica TaxID=2006980 RepID=A0A5R8QY59_9PSED|nr:MULTISPECIES: ABC transporter ATP-binding protein [Pseudomonas]MCF5230345.1 ATP-binding cassette domain-containing protein [Pseudomonas sp. PA-5-4H]MCF5239570.1 ATP-binding cassette domain-containing protein [Pseudomonas sp. PA-5-4G]MCF5248324.1 ATP-binding cassette domain-containing protein [Pseudomonas sp. PA-5-4B]MCF5252293.1 ATP-binding cassette domain-containing protein [Pseudomonas sp. PA-5-4B]MCF5259782.1 ATP-binding cassette domain-containing protein [Pseudomonas sp. PA-5-4A]